MQLKADISFQLKAICGQQSISCYKIKTILNKNIGREKNLSGQWAGAFAVEILIFFTQKPWLLLDFGARIYLLIQEETKKD